MVKPKRQSRRMSLKDKYKVQRKVREHHRKMRTQGKLPSKKHKDPGIPNSWPFKEQILMHEQKRAERLKEEAERQKEARRKQKLKQRKAALKAEAVKPGKASAGVPSAKPKREQEMARKARSDLKTVIAASDVLLEVLDVRDPLACRCKSLEQAVANDGKKKLVFVLNKVDLVPREVVEAWRAYLGQEFPTVVFKSATLFQKLVKRGGQQAKAAVEELGSSDSLGVDTLVQLLRSYGESATAEAPMLVGVVGLPNVGKSSVINSLRNDRVCKNATTRAAQEVKLNDTITLLDSPPIPAPDNEPDAAVMLRDGFDVKKTKDAINPVDVIRQRCKDANLMAFHEIAAFRDTKHFLTHIAVRKSKILPGGTHDLEGAARAWLEDWSKGVVPFYSLPPPREGAAVVADKVGDQSAAIARVSEGKGKEWIVLTPGTPDERELHLDAPESEEEESEEDMAVEGEDAVPDKDDGNYDFETDFRPSAAPGDEEGSEDGEEEGDEEEMET